MAATIFTALSNLRILNATETAAYAGINDTTYPAFRYAIEALIMLVFGTGITGSATSDPPNDTTGVLTDSAKSWSADEHNARTLIMTSGAAVGNSYVIDDTTATTVICTDDNLYADGVRSGDDYIIVYDLKTNEDGHDHDGVNSAQVDSPRGRTMVACHAGEESTQSESYVTVAAWRVYIPTNPSTLELACQMKTDNASYDAEARLQLTDSGSNTYASSKLIEGGTSWANKTGSVDVSAADAGYALLEIQLQTANAAATAYLQYAAIHWNT